MKLVTYSPKKSQNPSIAVLRDSRLIDITENWPDKNPPKSILHLINLGQKALEKIKKLKPEKTPCLSIDDVNILAPIISPPKIIALAGNYSEHIKEVGNKIGMSHSTANKTTPRPFIMPQNCITGTDTTIPWPHFSETIDYEVELAVIIANTCKEISPKNAQNYIFGYTIANDISARTVTFKKNRTQKNWDEFYDWLNGKWADAFLPTGPCIVTADQIPNPHNLDISLSVNGQIRQYANTSQMIHSIPQIVAFLSHIMTLTPGDIISTGTPSGVALPTGKFLKTGDTIKCSIQNIGTLSNTLGQKPAAFYNPLDINT